MTQSDAPLLKTLDTVLDDNDGDTVRFGDLVHRVEERGYGPLIAFLAAFVALPTGAIPGVPALIGVMLILLGGQMLIGSRLWFPSKLEDIEIETEKVHNAIEKARPWAERLESFVTNRLSALCTGPVSKRLTALCIVGCGAIMVPLGFVPFAPLVLGLSALVLGIGITARDGVWVAAGYALFVAGAFVALRATVM